MAPAVCRPGLRLSWTLGEAALLDAGNIRSRRAADDLRELSSLSEPHSTTTEVEELRTRIGATVAGV
ncbi:hypothetical protein [Nocardia nova]|uniref:hypothetical protein n=1 Tax=Nocardia nova TaxID=37330 RepID=UPI0033D40072